MSLSVSSASDEGAGPSSGARAFSGLVGLEELQHVYRSARAAGQSICLECYMAKERQVVPMPKGVLPDHYKSIHGSIAKSPASEKCPVCGNLFRCRQDLMQHKQELHAMQIYHEDPLYFGLFVKARMMNIDSLAPSSSYTYGIKVKCMKCGHAPVETQYLQLFQKVVSTAGSEGNLLFKCQKCGNAGAVQMLDYGDEITSERCERQRSTCVRVFKCTGCKPVEFFFTSGWNAVSVDGRAFKNIDLSEKYYFCYDNDHDKHVGVLGINAAFKQVYKKPCDGAVKYSRRSKAI